MGINLAELNYQHVGMDELSLSSAYARFGASFGKYAALEWRLGSGLEGDNQNIYGYRVKQEADLYYGAYFIGGVPISKTLYPYILLGYTQCDLKVSIDTDAIKLDYSDITLGIGLNVTLQQNLVLNAEYTRYIYTDEFELTAPSIGLTYFY